MESGDCIVRRLSRVTTGPSAAAEPTVIDIDKSNVLKLIQPAASIQHDLRWASDESSWVKHSLVVMAPMKGP